MKFITRFVYPWLYAFILLVIGTSLVEADTSANTLTISIQNNNSASYNNYPFIVSLNNTQLVNLGYISASGLNTQTSRTTTATNFPSGLTGSNLTVLVDQCLGNRVNTYSYKMGYDPARTDLDIITGNGGYVSVPDSPSLEPTVNVTTYVNTTAWYDPAWTYRKNLTVYGSSNGTQTNYQKLIRVMHNGAAPTNNTAENIAQLTTGSDSAWYPRAAIFYAQSFRAETTATAKKVWVKLSKVGVPTCLLNCTIWSLSSSGLPLSRLTTGTYLNEGYVSSASSDWYEFDLGSGTSLTLNSYYAIALSAPLANDTSYNYWWTNSSSSYTNGNTTYSTDSGATWSSTGAPNADFMFQVLSSVSGTTPLAISTEGNCQDDFDDIRFTTEDGSTLLDSWIEYKVDSWYADFWVELNSIVQMTGVSEHSHFSMYYGNAAATSQYASNQLAGEATFSFFDHFDSGYPLTKWTGTTTIGTVSGSNLIVTAPDANFYDIYSSVSLVTGSVNSHMRTSMIMYMPKYPFMGVYTNSTTGFYSAGSVLPMVTSPDYLSNYAQNVTSTFDIFYLGFRETLFWQNNTQLLGSYYVTSSSASTATRVRVRAWGNYSLDFSIDWIYLGNFEAPQPLWGVPASQETYSSVPSYTIAPSTFYLSWKGYFDNSTSGYLFGRPSSLSLNSTGSGGVVIYGNSTSLISYTPVNTGTRNITIYTPTNYTLKLDIDGVNVASSAIGAVADTSTAWTIAQCGPARSTEWVLYRVAESLKMQLQPTTIVSGSSLLDSSGCGNTGYIVWGSNPSGTVVSTLGIASTGSYAMGSVTIDPDYTPTVVPVPGVVNLGGDEAHVSTPPIIPTGYDPDAPDPMAGVDPITPGGLPVYELVSRAADSLGWTPNTLYAVLMWMTAVAMGAGAFIATGSLFGGGIMLVGTLAVASSTGVIAAWIPILMGLALVFIVVLSRSM